LIVPMVRWALSRLVGWHETGTVDDRRRLVQLPLVTFGPADRTIGHAGHPGRT